MDRGLDAGQLLGLGEGASPLMMLVWVLPVVLLVFYGQRIQLYVTSGEIKKGIRRLDAYGSESRGELVAYVRGLAPGSDPEGRVDRFLDYFTIMPVDADPAGIIGKIRHTVRSREGATRRHIEAAIPGIGRPELARAQALLEVASSLRMMHKAINHAYLTAKRQRNYPLILPLQMLLPTVLENAEAMMGAIPAFRAGQPVGDGIGPMAVGRMMVGLEKEEAALETVAARTELEGRRLLLIKARGPEPTVGRPADALEAAAAAGPVDAVVMVDAALKLEGEESATIAHGFGAAMGGIGTERFQIEEIAAKRGAPVVSIVVRESVGEALSLMTEEVADLAEEVGARAREAALDAAQEGQTVAVIGVGNTSGVGQ